MYSPSSLSPSKLFQLQALEPHSVILCLQDQPTLFELSSSYCRSTMNSQDLSRDVPQRCKWLTCICEPPTPTSLLGFYFAKMWLWSARATFSTNWLRRRRAHQESLDCKASTVAMPSSRTRKSRPRTSGVKPWIPRKLPWS